MKSRLFEFFFSLLLGITFIPALRFFSDVFFELDMYLDFLILLLSFQLIYFVLTTRLSAKKTVLVYFITTTVWILELILLGEFCGQNERDPDIYFSTVTIISSCFYSITKIGSEVLLSFYTHSPLKPNRIDQIIAIANRVFKT